MMSSQQIKQLLFVLVVFQLSACATLFNGGSQRVYVETSPPSTASAIVHDNNYPPYQINLPTFIQSRPSSFSNLFVELDDECFSPSSSIVEKYVAAPYWLNVLNFHGLYVDYFTGGMWKYDDHLILPVSTLEKETSTSSDNAGDDCSRDADTLISERIAANQFKFVGKNALKYGNEKLRNNMLSFNWITSKNIVIDSGKGTGFSYLRHLSRQDMINVSMHRRQWSTCSYYFDCGNYSTYQNALLVSLRRYLTPTSKFFTGIGAARINLVQEAVWYTFPYDSESASPGKSWRDNTNTLFFETGWLVRKGLITFKVRAMVDFSDLYLVHPSLTNKNYLARDFSDSIERRRALDYRAASSLTGIELGIGFSF